LKNTNGDGFIMAHKGDLTIKIPQVRGLYRRQADHSLCFLSTNKVAEQRRPPAAEYLILRS